MTSRRAPASDPPGVADEVLTARASLPLPGSAGRPRELRLRRYRCAARTSLPRPCKGRRTADGCGPCWVSDARVLVVESEEPGAKLHRRAIVVPDEELRARTRFGAFQIRPEDLIGRRGQPVRIVSWWGAILIPPERIGHPRFDDPDWVRRPPRAPLPPLPPGSRGSLPPGFRLVALEETDEVPISPATARRMPFRLMAYGPEGSLCGRADVYWTYDGELMVSDVWVEPARRRQGLATAMYCAIERLARTTLTPYPEQSEDGRLLWEQADRPFGQPPER